MLRLTLRDGRDGRLLARVVDRDGSAFVLDYGDPEIMADAARRVMQGGFVVQWEDAHEKANPGSPILLRQLALHYVEQGILVFIDEPTWTRRAADERAPPQRDTVVQAEAPTSRIADVTKIIRRDEAMRLLKPSND